MLFSNKVLMALSLIPALVLAGIRIVVMISLASTSMFTHAAGPYLSAGDILALLGPLILGVLFGYCGYALSSSSMPLFIQIRKDYASQLGSYLKKLCALLAGSFGIGTALLLLCSSLLFSALFGLPLSLPHGEASLGNIALTSFIQLLILSALSDALYWTLFCLFSFCCGLILRPLFLAALAPFCYLFIENAVTATLKIPSVSLVSFLYIGRLSPEAYLSFSPLVPIAILGLSITLSLKLHLKKVSRNA